MLLSDDDGYENPSYAFFFVSDAFCHWHWTSLGLRISISLLALDVFPSDAMKSDNFEG